MATPSYKALISRCMSGLRRNFCHPALPAFRFRARRHSAGMRHRHFRACFFRPHQHFAFADGGGDGREEFCALVDASDAFDPVSAAAAGVALERLLWIRCGGNAEHALKATDLVLQAGGFGLVVMDLGDIAPATARRISLASWYRLRHAVENTPTALVVIERAPHARACASLRWNARGTASTGRARRDARSYCAGSTFAVERAASLCARQARRLKRSH